METAYNTKIGPSNVAAEAVGLHAEDPPQHRTVPITLADARPPRLPLPCHTRFRNPSPAPVPRPHGFSLLRVSEGAPLAQARDCLSLYHARRTTDGVAVIRARAHRKRLIFWANSKMQIPPYADKRPEHLHMRPISRICWWKRGRDVTVTSFARTSFARIPRPLMPYIRYFGR